MVEAAPSPAELDIQLAQETLGVAVAVDPAARPEGYNEEWAILERALGVRTAVFDASMAVAEQQLGMTITDEMIAAWPDEATAAHMHGLLARERKKVGMLEGIDTFVREKDVQEEIGGTQLRWNQNDAIHKTQRFAHDIPPSSWQRSGKCGLINSATGTGKTGIFSKLTAMCKYGENPQEPVRVLIVTPRQTLITQTKGAFQKFAPGIEPGLYYEDEHDMRDVTVISQASFDALSAKGLLPDFDVVIVDEAHKVGPITDGHLRTYCVDKILLGVTATPTDRTRALFEHEIHEHQLRDAIQDGILAPVRAQDILEEPDWSQYEGTLPTDDPGALRRARRQIRMEHWREDAIKHVEAGIKRGVGVVIRCPAGGDIKFAKDYAEMLRDRWIDMPVREGRVNNLGLATVPRKIRAVAIGGQEHIVKEGGVTRTIRGAELKRLQQKAREDFENGEIDVLIYVEALGLGWDCPRAKVFIDMYPRGTEGEVKQPIGRALRLLEDEDNNPIKAEIITYVDPDFPGQITGCHVLNVRSGESIEHTPVEVRAQRPTPRTRAPEGPTEHHVVHVVGGAATSVVVEEVEVTHAERPTARYDGDDSILTMNEAAARSGLGALAFARLWREKGLRPDDLVFASELRGDLERIWVENEQLRPEPLPETGFVHESVVLPQLQSRRPLKTAGLRQLAARHGYPSKRFITNEGLIGFYYPEEQVPGLIAAIGRR